MSGIEDPLLEVTPDRDGNTDVTEAVLAQAIADSASTEAQQIA